MGSKCADGPLPLLRTPLKETGKEDDFTLDASHMSVVHNVILRGYNSIYKQAQHVRPHDIRDFIGYSKAWVEMVLGHHHSEETVLFPMYAEAAGVPDLFDTDKHEHEAFYGGLDKFKKYLDEQSASNPADTFSGAVVVTLMDGFGQALYVHLKNEPPHLASLNQYSIEKKDLARIRKAAEEDSMNRTSAIHLLPMLWYNHDVEYEDGLWRDFPGLHWALKWIMVNVFGWWRSNWWRFGGVDRNGKLQPLLALRDDYA